MEYHFCSEEALIERLGEYVKMETPSEDWARINALFARMAEDLTALGARVSEVEGDGCQLLRADVGHGEKRLLLLGHVDTVFKVGDETKNPFREEEGRLRGPGVLDMKAGDVMIQELLRHFVFEEQRGKLEGFTITALFNGDEETGSHHSERAIRELSREAMAVFVLEPSVPGKCTVARKGLAAYRIIARGISAHSGVNYQKGASAIEALSRVLAKIYDLRDDERNISINIGSLEAPGKNNIISDYAMARGEVRAFDPRFLTETLKEMERICRENPVKGTSVTFERMGMRPAMAQTKEMKALHTMAMQSAAVHGLKLEGRIHGGGSDGSFAAEEGAVVIDGMGAEGDGSHTLEEYVVKATLMPRLMTLCDVMMRIIRQNRIK